MISEEKISKFLALLIDDTKRNKVKWEKVSYNSINSLEGEQRLIGYVFETRFKKQDLRLYKYSEPVQISEWEYLRKSYYKLEFLDIDDNVLWAFPFYIRELLDLYNTVQIKTSGIDKYFDEIIPDDPTVF